MYKNHGHDDSGGSGDGSDAGHSCRVCGRMFSTISALNSHMRDEHGHGQFTINTTDVVDDDASKKNSSKVKDKSLKRVADDDDEEDNSPSKKTLLAAAASLIDLSIAVESKASEQHQQPEQHRCDLCNKVFSTGNALGGHRVYCIRTHQQAQPSLIPAATTSVQYRCDLCGKVVSTPQALGSHKDSASCKRMQELAQSSDTQAAQSALPPSSATSSVQYQCDLCNKVVLTAPALASHRTYCKRRQEQTQSSAIHDDSAPPQPSQPAPSAMPPSSADSSVQGQAAGGSQHEDQVEVPADLNRTQPRRDDEDDASSGSPLSLSNKY